MKKRIITLISILAVVTLYVSAQGIDSTEYKVRDAIGLLRGAKGRIDQAKSFKQLSELAGKGSAKAMNALGLYYLENNTEGVDTLNGIGWLRFAGESGYAQAWYNLGIVYKYGRSGIKQDLVRSFQCMEKAAIAGNAGGMYYAGYMLYKGLGCKQDYEKSVTYFRLGIMHQSSSCMYMLGLCYRNGYGVDRDAGNANYWLSMAAKSGYEFAAAELATEEPENSLTRTTLRSSSAVTAPAVFPRIPHLRSLRQNNLDGEYEGVLVTYDWSGKVVLKETPLFLTIKSNGTEIESEWREQGADTIQVKGVWQDTCLQFTQAIQARADHYTGNDKMLWSFTDARLQVLNDESGSILIGNVQMYSPETMEPNRPVYLSLRKISGESFSISGNESEERFVVYPNPFSDGLNISFYQQKRSEVKIAIYNATGNCIYATSLGKYEAGQQKMTLALPLSTGVYVMKLNSGGREYQSVVIRK